MTNLHTNGTMNQTLLGVPMHKLENRLDALLLILKSCKTKTCRRPWEALHEDGAVKTLTQALSPNYDTFYENQNKVKYEKCEKGYIVNNELPIQYLTYGNHSTIEERNAEALANWELFTD